MRSIMVFSPPRLDRNASRARSYFASATLDDEGVMMRICAVSLPELRVEVVRAPNTQGPLAIVVAPPPLDEAKLVGNTRLDVVSREARTLGVRPRQTIAQARARTGGALAVRVRTPPPARNSLPPHAPTAPPFPTTVPS